MIKNEKINKVRRIKEEFTNNSGIIFTDHTNLKSDQSVQIRDRFYEVEATLMILKNTLARIAAAESFKDLNLGEILKGPTSAIISHKDLIATAKVLKNIIREFDILKPKGAIIEGRLINANDVNMLANLPPREVLVSQFINGLASPIYMLVYVLNNLPQKLVLVLSEIQKRKSTPDA